MANLRYLEIDIADVRTVAHVELQAIRTQLQAIGAACSDVDLMQLITTAQRQVAEADDLIAGQIDALAQDLKLFAAAAPAQEVCHV